MAAKYCPSPTTQLQVYTTTTIRTGDQGDLIGISLTSSLCCGQGRLRDGADSCSTRTPTSYSWALDLDSPQARHRQPSPGLSEPPRTIVEGWVVMGLRFRRAGNLWLLPLNPFVWWWCVGVKGGAWTQELAIWALGGRFGGMRNGVRFPRDAERIDTVCYEWEEQQ
jgi:hypothetical protein